MARKTPYLVAIITALTAGAGCGAITEKTKFKLGTSMGAGNHYAQVRFEPKCETSFRDTDRDGEMDVRITRCGTRSYVEKYDPENGWYRVK